MLPVSLRKGNPDRSSRRRLAHASIAAMQDSSVSWLSSEMESEWADIGFPAEVSAIRTPLVQAQAKYQAGSK
jgi:hypothetical protein